LSSSDSSSPTGSRSSSRADQPRRQAIHEPSFDCERLARPTLDAARALIGARLVRVDGEGRRVGRIVEVEAYIGEDDRASHARFGETDRNRVMFGQPGVAYVYLVYGMYDCLNVVTEPASRPAALLVRAVEPLEGIERMRAARAGWLARRRGLSEDSRVRERARLAAMPPDRLACGPGLVTAAFSIDRSHTGVDLCDPSSSLRLESPPAGEPPFEIVIGPRVGIGYAGQPWTTMLWRFAIRGNPAVSGPPIRA
jgi:DNA-3-methyladenine glycosylase